MNEVPDGLIGIMGYNTELFDATTIVRILADYHKVLGAIISKPEYRISQLLRPLGLMEPKLPPEKVAYPHDNKEIYPLSHGQQSMWVLYQLAPESGVYNIALTLRIRSTLDVPALQNTFQALINRHPCLRTTFTTREGEPLQKVHQDQIVRFEPIDASTWSREELNKRVVEANQRPFDHYCRFSSHGQDSE